MIATCRQVLEVSIAMHGLAHGRPCWQQHASILGTRFMSSLVWGISPTTQHIVCVVVLNCLINKFLFLSDYGAYKVSKVGVCRLTELLVETIGKDPSKPGLLINMVSTIQSQEQSKRRHTPPSPTSNMYSLYTFIGATSQLPPSPPSPCHNSHPHVTTHTLPISQLALPPSHINVLPLSRHNSYPPHVTTHTLPTSQLALPDPPHITTHTLPTSQLALPPNVTTSLFPPGPTPNIKVCPGWVKTQLGTMAATRSVEEGKAALYTSIQRATEVTKMCECRSRYSSVLGFATSWHH